MEKNKGVDFRRLPGSSAEIVPSPFDSLPEECISNIISFTTPRDACIAASLSKTFRSATDSDSVWDKFLPPEYYSSLTLGSQVISSKKDLYFTLSDHFLIEDGNKSFWLEKGSGKKCLMLSSKDLVITFDYISRFWEMVTVPEARFEKVASLLSVWGYEIRGRMHTRYLSPRTRYSAHIVYKTTNECANSPDLPLEVGVKLVGQENCTRVVYVDRYRYMDKRARKEGERRGVVIKPKKREDGWLEVEFGEFFNEDGYDQIEFSIVETKAAHWKSNLFIQGIEFRPANER